MLKKTIFLNISILIISSIFYGFIINPDKNILNSESVIFDLRSIHEFKKEHAKGSIQIDYDFFESKLIKSDFKDFLTFLKISGVSENTKIYFLLNKEEDIEKSLFLSFFLKLFNIKDINLIKGGLDEWKKRGLPTQSVGRKLETNFFQPRMNENEFFAQPDRNLLSQKNTVIILCEKNLGYAIKGSITLDLADFILDGSLKEIENIKKDLLEKEITPNKKIFLYPQQNKKTYIIAYLMKYYLEYKNTKILKGEKNQWLKLRILQKE